MMRRLSPEVKTIDLPRDLRSSGLKLRGPLWVGFLSGESRWRTSGRSSVIVHETDSARYHNQKTTPPPCGPFSGAVDDQQREPPDSLSCFHSCASASQYFASANRHSISLDAAAQFIQRRTWQRGAFGAGDCAGWWYGRFADVF